MGEEPKSRIRLSKRALRKLGEESSEFNGALLGLSRVLLDHLISHRPRMIPKDFWGGDLGWRSGKRKKSWESLLTQNGIMVSPTNLGM